MSVSNGVSAPTQFSSRKELSFSPVPTEASGSSAGKTVDGHRDEGAARVSFISQGSEQELSDDRGQSKSSVMTGVRARVQ